MELKGRNRSNWGQRRGRRRTEKVHIPPREFKSAYHKIRDSAGGEEKSPRVRVKEKLGEVKTNSLNEH